MKTMNNLRTIENVKPKTHHETCKCFTTSCRKQSRTIIVWATLLHRPCHLLVVLVVVLVVVLTIARPHHRPHCNVAVVFPNDHVQSPTIVHFLRRDSTCRSPFSVVCQSYFCVTSSSLPLLHMRFCNRSRSTRKSFSPPFPNSRHFVHSAVITRQDNDNLAKDFLLIDFLHWVLSHFVIAAVVFCGVLPLSYVCRSTRQYHCDSFMTFSA